MAETATIDIAAGITSDERTYAVRYKQGGRTVYGMQLTPLQIVNMIAKPDPSESNLGNRAINEKHAREFAEYYLSHPDWIIPGIILRAPDIFKYRDGILSYAKRHARSIQILDGQHRILGFHLAASMIQKQIDSAREFVTKALRAEGKGSAVHAEALAQLESARALEKRFDSEQVTVEVQVTENYREFRQMFFDIADNQVGISGSVRARFDSRKVVNRALEEVLDHPLLIGRVELERDRLKRAGVEMMTARHVADIIRAVQAGVDGRIGKVRESLLVDKQVARDAFEFLDLLLEAFPPLEALRIGQVNAETLRTSGLLGSPAMLRVLGGVYHDLLSGEHGWTKEQVKEYFQVLAPHFVGPAHPDSIWHRIQAKNDAGEQNVFPDWSYSPNGRRQDLFAVAKALTDWAILGEKGAPWVCSEPAPIPPRPQSDEEVAEAEQLAADIAADPELGELLAKQAQAQEKAQEKAQAAKKS